MIVEITSTPIAVDVWKQERVVLHYTHPTPSSIVGMWTNLHGSYGSPLAIYTSDTNGDVYIDMTDYIRTYGTQVTNIYVYGDVQYTIVPTIKGLIDPASVLIPASKMLQKIGGTGILCPPAMMIVPINNLTTKTEVYGYASGSATYYDDNGTIGAQNFSELALNIPNAATQVRYNSGAYKQNFTPMRCGLRYCAVRWVSFTGKTRQHTFEATKPTNASADAFDLLPIDNEYVNIKGRADGFTLRLDNLCAYDLWYYADLIMSSKVEVSMDGTTFNRVQVTSKDITLPDGDAGMDGKIEIKVNWKRYDAVIV